MNLSDYLKKISEAIDFVDTDKDDKFDMDPKQLGSKQRPDGKVVTQFDEYEVLLSGPNKVWDGSSFLIMHGKKTAGVIGMSEEYRQLNAMDEKLVQISTSVISKAYEGKGLMYRAYIALIKAGYHLLSDGSQTAGGQKLWSKMAQTKGVYVYAVAFGSSNYSYNRSGDDGGKNIKFYDVDPDDITDGKITTYINSSAQQEADKLHWYIDGIEDAIGELNSKISRAKKNSPEYAALVDERKMYEKEFKRAQADEKKILSRIEKGQKVNVRLMATTKRKKASKVSEGKGNSEPAYELELIRSRDEDVLKVTSNRTDKWIEIRGKPNYETHGHDENDPLHKFLDKLDPATVAALMAGDVKFLNPNNSRTTPSIDQTRAAWNEPSMAEAISSINVGKDEKFGIKFDVIRRSGKVIGRMGELEVLQTPDIGFVNDRVAPGFIVWDPVKKKTAGVLMAKRGRSAEGIHAKTVAISVTAVNSEYEGQGIMLKLYVLLIRKGFALLSDDQQTPGGQKIWARLAKVPGVTVYAVDLTAPEGKQYSAVDPDDITDANFMVYDDDVETLQNLEKERKKLYADKFELVDEMNIEQEKVDNDEVDASPTKVRELDDRIKVIEREISAITKEIKPWLRHKETGLGAKLMAVKTKTATTESTQLTELFNQPYAWHWDLEGKNAAIAKFDTADEGVISVFFQSVSPNSPNFETGFKKGISIKRSGEGDQFRIMTTVTKIIEEFMAKNPHVLSLSFVAKREGAAAEDPKIRDSRAVLYQRMIQKFAEKHGYEFASAKVGRMTEFMIRRRETAAVAETDEVEIRKPHPKDTLGVKRQDMPQVHRDHYPELLKYLSSHGGQIRHDEVHAHELKAVQSEFSDTGVRKMMSTGGRPSDSIDKKPLIVSSDNYIIDGHHRWLAAWNQDEVVPIMQVSLPVRKLLQLIRDFPHTTYKDIHEQRTPLEQACLEGGHAYEAPLDEIKTIAPLKNDDANFERAAAKLKMVADGKYIKIRDVGVNTIYMSNDLASSGDDGYVMMTNRDVTEMIGYLQMRAMGRYVEVPKSYKAAMAWVNPKYRRQGVASAMYDTVLDHGYSLVADADQTKDSQKVWTKLVSRHGGYLLADGNIMSGMNDRAWALAYKKNAPYNYTILITGKGVTVKENISVTGTARHKQEQQKKLVPGSEAWFKHWFSLPYLKREDVDRLKEEIVNHIKTHKGVRHEKKVRNG